MSNRNLAEYLAELIGTGGPISISRYMAEALGHPAFGYYMTRDPIGAAGDFITAPEVSQLFGEMIGLWMADAWQTMAAPEDAIIVEMGPGRGTLMADALRAAATVPEIDAGTAVHLIETSPVLRPKQAEALSAQNVTWHDRLDTIPDNTAIFIANEFIDALPIRQFQRCLPGWRERMVDWDHISKTFRIVLGDTDSNDLIPDSVRNAPIDSIVEICDPARGIVAEISQHISRFGGIALLIDYGYAASRCGETLQAVRDHKTADIFESPGNADLCAHVDFAPLQAEAESNGAAAHGPTTQGDFLNALGIGLRASQLIQGATAEEESEINAGLARLTEADQMGSLFKVLVISKAGAPAPPGFEVST